MLKFLRNLLIAVIVVLSVLLTASYFCLQSPLCWQRVLLQISHERWNNVKVKEIDLERVYVTYEGVLDCTNIRIKAQINGLSYTLMIGKLHMSNLWSLLSKHGEIPLSISHGSMKSDLSSVDEIEIQAKAYFNGFAFDYLEGDQQELRLTFDKYHINNLTEHLFVNTHQIRIENLKASCYKGHFKAEIVMDYAPQMSYSMSYDLVDIDLEELSKIDDKLWGNIKGVIQGRVEYLGDAKGIRGFKSYLVQPKGGLIRSSLLQYLVQSVPQRTQLEDLIKNNEYLPLDNAEFRIVELSDDKLSLSTKMASSRLSLNMNVDVDINIDGGVLGLLRHLKQFSQ